MNHRSFASCVVISLCLSMLTSQVSADNDGVESSDNNSTVALQKAFLKMGRGRDLPVVKINAAVRLLAAAESTKNETKKTLDTLNTTYAEAIKQHGEEGCAKLYPKYEKAKKDFDTANKEYEKKYEYLNTLTSNNFFDWFKRGMVLGFEEGIEKAAAGSVEKAIQSALGDSLNDALSFASSGVFGTIKGTWKFLYKWATWRSGKPFEAQELYHVQQSICMCLDDLYNVAQKSSKIGGRDKELRIQLEEEQDVVDPAWKWQRDCIEDELKFTTMYLDAGLIYYTKDSDNDRRVRFYTQQLRSWLDSFVEHMLRNTKSYKDTGSSNFTFALAHLRSNVNRTFTNLINHVSPAFFSRDTKSNKNQQGHRGGMNNYNRRDNMMMGGMSPYGAMM